MNTHLPSGDAAIVAESSFHDPYDAMSDQDFDAYVSRLFDKPQGPTRSITVRMPEDLLSRLQHLASTHHMPYQRLMRRMLEESVSGLERRVATSMRASPKKTEPAESKPTAARRTRNRR
jgi:predicted DNA binding CopG/RHH family protein